MGKDEVKVPKTPEQKAINAANKAANEANSEAKLQQGIATGQAIAGTVMGVQAPANKAWYWKLLYWVVGAGAVGAATYYGGPAAGEAAKAVANSISGMIGG